MICLNNFVISLILLFPPINTFYLPFKSNLGVSLILSPNAFHHHSLLHYFLNHSLSLPLQSARRAYRYCYLPNCNIISSATPYYIIQTTWLSIINFQQIFQNQTIFSMPKNPNQVAKFILKLAEILQQEKYQQSIRWTQDGAGVQIKNRKQLEINILPEHFKLKKVTSFIRQLHLYGFYKTRNTKRINTFEHPCFKKQLTKDYSKVKRKYRNQQIDVLKESLQSITNQDKNIPQPVLCPPLCSIKSLSMIFQNSDQKICPNELNFESWYLSPDDNLSFLLEDCLN